MFYQPDINTLGYFMQQQPPPVDASAQPTGLSTGYVTPKGGQFTREERDRLRSLERRRKKIRDVKAGCKRFMAWLCSLIGLSILLVSYVIVGGIVFVNIEATKEIEIKQSIVENRQLFSSNLIILIVDRIHDSIEEDCSNLSNQTTNDTLTCIQTRQYLKSISSHLARENVEANTTAQSELFDNSTFTNISSTSNSTNLTLTFDPDANQSTTPLVVETTEQLPEQLIKLIESIKREVNRGLFNFSKKIVNYTNTEGWNGNDDRKDLKWSLSGAILYAITVVTTIGYGHTTPKTDTGKILTILYALFGIPLVFLYLSNIGDYLAYLFRSIYSKTCRGPCERFCTLSIISSAGRAFYKRLIGRLLRGQKAGLALSDIDLADVEGHAAVAKLRRRRKRVLLGEINPALEEKEEEELPMQESESVFDTAASGSYKMEHQKSNQEDEDQTSGDFMANTADEESSQSQTPDVKVKKRWRSLLVQSKILRALKSAQSNTMIVRAKSNLNELMEPVTSWVKQITELLNEDEIDELNALSEARQQMSAFYSPSKKAATVPVDIGTISDSPMPPIPLGALPHSGMYHSSMLPSELTGGMHTNPALCKQASLPLWSVAGSVGQSMPFSRQALTTFTGGGPPMVVTSDGLHRKYYLAGRYLRSAARRRRHKRLMAKRLKERHRAEQTRLENALSYGLLNEAVGHSERTGRYSTFSVKGNDGIKDEEDEDATEALSLATDMSESNAGIQLLCWKDIDLDLEVRSVDDDLELRSLQERGLDISDQSEPDVVQGGDTLVREDAETTLVNRRKKVSRTTSKHQSDSIQSSSRLKQVYCPDIGHDKSQALIISNPTAINEVESTSRQLYWPNQRVVITDQPGRCQTLPASHLLRHPSSLKEHQSMMNSNHFNIYQPPPIGEQHRSMVIANQHAQLVEGGEERPADLGKSRLSIASSQGDTNSDVRVQLSYYSVRGSAVSEELSLFSFGDGFTDDEDLSKVTVPISLSLLIMFVYIQLGALLFTFWEDSNYLKWSYFCFITLTTIGFGDIVPGTKIDNSNTKEKMAIISLYVAVGLSVFAMCFKLMQEEVVEKTKWLTSKISMFKKRTKEKSEKSI